MRRPTFTKIFMDMAIILAHRSVDSKYKVGVVIASEDNHQVLSIGYNGNYHGGPNVRDSEETGKSGFIHGEINALLKLDYNLPKRKVMYLTMAPCMDCAKAIIQANIYSVIFKDDYLENEGIALLKSVGIRCFKYDECKEYETVA
jgi:dCMP deaminase